MKKVAIFGAAPDTGNMGVSALLNATISGLRRNIENVEFVIADNGIGIRQGNIRINHGEELNVTFIGMRAGWRLYLSENLLAMEFMSRLGKFGAVLNPILKELDSCDAVLDVSGGDSFSDIYGRKRFLSILRPKRIAINRAIPLILLPQTYGPFKTASYRHAASKVTKCAKISWSRDINSYEILKKLVGSSFDEKYHRSGVDMAFGLVPDFRKEKISPQIGSYIDGTKPVVGLNVSGLIYLDKKSAKENYGFQLDYTNLIKAFVAWLLDQTDANIILIPHVMAEVGNYESDYEASLQVQKELDGEHRARLDITLQTLSENEVKGVISQCDWFCGTRMHATIASLSTQVPTSSIVYSDKAAGVFQCCGQEGQIIDPRKEDFDTALQKLKESFLSRTKIKESLGKNIPPVIENVENQYREIANLL